MWWGNGEMGGVCVNLGDNRGDPLKQRHNGPVDRGDSFEWPAYNKAFSEWVGGRHTSWRHTCHKQSPAIVRFPAIEAGMVKG